MPVDLSAAMAADGIRDRESDETAGLQSIRRAVAVLVVAMAILYPLSLGPACWTMARLGLDRTQFASCVSHFYLPLAPLIIHGPPYVQSPMRWWIGVGMSPSTVYHSLPDGIVWTNPGYSYTLWHY
jgi:hypothetical protein